MRNAAWIEEECVQRYFLYFLPLSKSCFVCTKQSLSSLHKKDSIHKKQDLIPFFYLPIDLLLYATYTLLWCLLTLSEYDERSWWFSTYFHEISLHCYSFLMLSTDTPILKHSLIWLRHHPPVSSTLSLLSSTNL